MTDDLISQLRTALGDAYLIERELGGGGMSRVFLAREVALGREVVLKVLSPELTSGVNRDRFRREVHYAAQLQHPHIVPLLTAGESEGLLWYTMPRIAGESLREVLDRRGALPVDEVLQMLADVADALGSAHQRGLVHRDIKPENILIQGSHALVTDFGVAKAISAALPGSGATAVGVAIGTPAYMAPEQVAGDPDADHRIDLYALGLLAYELLTGETPFRGNSPHQTMAAHLIRQATPPDALRADLPSGLSAVVMRCLQKDPAERYPDAAALLADLRAVATGSGGRTAVAGGRSRVRKPVGHAVRYGVLGAALTIALVVIVVLAMERVTVVVGSPPPADSASPSSANGVASTPAQLTLADSIAIAQAVERRLAEQQAASDVTRAILDSIRREITRAVTDSVRQAEASGPPRWAAVPPPRAGQQASDLPVRRPAPTPSVPASTPGFQLPTDTGLAKLVLMTLDDPRLAVLTDGAHRRVLDSLATVLDRLPGVSRVAAPDLEAGLRFSEALTKAGEATDSRFVISVVPTRRRDSVGYSITIQDREARIRPVRTVRTPFVPMAEAGAALTDTVAAQVRRTIVEMRRAGSRGGG